MELKDLLQKKVVNNNRLYKMLVDEVGSGPLDGACVVLALALKEVVGGEVYVIESSTRHSKVFQAQHAVLKVGNLYADADGLFNEKELLKKWIDEEDLVEPSLRRFKGTDLKESPRPKKLVNKLVAYFKGDIHKEGNMSKAQLVKELFEQLHDFDQALTSFLQDSQKKVDISHRGSEEAKLEKSEGPKYIRIIYAISSGGKVISRSAWAFVDKETGDVYKPAGWKTPAKKTPRANIFKPDSWITGITAYGPVYLR